MLQNTQIERLTSLDTLMPRTYVSAVLTFRTSEPTASVASNLQLGLKGLLKQVPWISGRVFPSAAVKGKTYALEMRWSPDDAPPTLIDRGQISASYDTLAASGMPPEAVPAEFWAVPPMVDEATFQAGVPVFAASFFRFADNPGFGLCISIHHNVVDATSFNEIVRLWAENIAGGASTPSLRILDRVKHLEAGLSSQLDAIASPPDESLLASHPEFSKMPPQFPAEFPVSTSKLFRIPISQLDGIKTLVGTHMQTPPSTNTLLSALIWSAITRVRAQRNPGLLSEDSKLVTAVNGRRRIDTQDDTLYLGNLVLYALSKQSVEDLKSSSTGTSPAAIAKICEAITKSQSAVNSQHIAEVYKLVDSADDPRTIFVGWDLFNSRDLTITSWADLNFYEMHFGAPLGKPEFVRTPYAEADGVAMILPRNRAAGSADEILDVVIMLRKDDLGVLEGDNVWKALTK